MLKDLPVQDRPASSPTWPRTTEPSSTRGSAPFWALCATPSEAPRSFPSYNWQYFLLPFFAGMGFFMLGFLWFQMRDSASRMLVLTALGMLVCGISIDFVEGLGDELHLRIRGPSPST